MDEAHRAFTLRRPFGWGIVIIRDAATEEWPDRDELGLGQIVASSECIIAPVHHASDRAQSRSAKR